ncbi:hypothetical protein HanXRQr2_Chr06g0251391 [Helianthus annuus]|uniref:Uncharacterized protein n=1 Tax=Helianthus annuus TaxID=4232 RepID=A0A251UGY4_HELAN|nr:hypothetical protein HanXRQr2_Chr06g0251391 [Helianthus annuus]KAJ0559978.1 hypothetical protein HanHA300_Chr06g0206431 [Helianthus annuus]KAJ0572968.1 hypothetical protein HanHA89_Chr06g0221591 [Helianthus annuus]KAJ0737410.1 hypothetical protein HanLR1_Chr06g0206691 [Helianthus annuus]KAJ0740278.1 hypothetical protein HanOQP8_Chr06g0215091 [Helianthus annuus]
MLYRLKREKKAPVASQVGLLENTNYMVFKEEKSPDPDSSNGNTDYKDVIMEIISKNSFK